MSWATILHKAWMENKVSKEIFKAKAVLLIPRIKKELSHPTNTPLSIKEKTSSLWPSFVKYAAVIAVAILSASTLYFYQEQSMIEEMMAQEVIFSSPTGQCVKPYSTRWYRSQSEFTFYSEIQTEFRKRKP